MEKPNVIEHKEFNHLVGVIRTEIEQSQVRLVVAANVQLLLHYWKVGHIISYYQQQLGWGGKVIERISKAIKQEHPNKKGYSPRNLKYMCQLAKQYRLNTIQKLIDIDCKAEDLTIESVSLIVRNLNEFEFGQAGPAQIQTSSSNSILIKDSAQVLDMDIVLNTFGQEAPAQLEEYFASSPIATINWSSHMALMNSGLPLGLRYWYMKQALENGWSSNVLDMQIKNDLFGRQIKEGKVNNFQATLPKVHSDLANYLLKDPYIFDLAGAKEPVDERDIEEQLATHVTKYLLEMGSGFAFVARQNIFRLEIQIFIQI